MLRDKYQFIAFHLLNLILGDTGAFSSLLLFFADFPPLFRLSLTHTTCNYLWVFEDMVTSALGITSYNTSLTDHRSLIVHVTFQPASHDIEMIEHGSSVKLLNFF